MTNEYDAIEGDPLATLNRVTRVIYLSGRRAPKRLRRGKAQGSAFEDVAE